MGEMKRPKDLVGVGKAGLGQVFDQMQHTGSGVARSGQSQRFLFVYRKGDVPQVLRDRAARVIVDGHARGPDGFVDGSAMSSSLAVFRGPIASQARVAWLARSL